MALIDRDIVITPNKGVSTEPIIKFTGADSSSSATITLRVLNTSTTGILRFEGSSSQLLSITDSITGTVLQVSGMTRAAGFSSAQQTVTSTTATTNLNFGLYDHFYITLSSNTTFTVSNAGDKIGSVGHIVLKQDSTGGWVFTKPAEMKTPLGGATIAQVTSSNSMSVISYYITDASTILINYIGNFA